MKKVLALVAMLLVATILLSSCSYENDESDQEKIESIVNKYRMVSVKSEMIIGCIGTRIIQTVVDTETGIMYFYCENSHASFLTPVLDSDGKPMKYEGDYSELMTSSN